MAHSTEDKITELALQGNGRPAILESIPEASEWQVRSILKKLKNTKVIKEEVPETLARPNMKILGIDIETSPNIAYVWGLFNQNISPNQIIETSRMLSYAYKWFDDPSSEVEFVSEWKQGKKDMIKLAWELLDEADAVVHYNGVRFDVPAINTEFLKYGLLPPSPFKQIDLLQTARKMFRFSSNKLEHLLVDLKIGKKVKHSGFEMWAKCLAGDKEARKEMETYNIGDVEETEKLYRRLLPWISNHPNHALYFDTNRPVCPNCGSSRLVSRGKYMSKTQEYKRFVCKECGTWTRERFTAVAPAKRRKIMTQAI